MFLAHNYIVDHNPNLTKAEKKKLKEGTFKGWEIVHGTARVCAMNLLLHGIGSDESMPIIVGDALLGHPGEYFDIVLTNPPFGKKSSITIVGAEGEVSKERETYERDDFWATTSNKQLNFLQHVKTLSQDQRPRRHRRAGQRAVRGRGRGDRPAQALARVRCAYAPASADRPLLRPGREGQRALLRQEAGERDPVDQEALDLRPPHQHALHAQDRSAQARRPRRVRDLLQPGRIGTQRKPTWSDKNPDGRWRAYDYDELINRDKASLDIFWLKDESLEDSDNLPDPDVIAQEIVDDLEAALEQFRLIANDLGSEPAK